MLVNDKIGYIRRLDKSDDRIDSVITMGRLMVKHGQAIVERTFEE
ncbi:hypothetical protein [Anoxybacillus sp. B7M1]|nr:hypothetical protein [Anoxybacillus sp. B7M1]